MKIGHIYRITSPSGRLYIGKSYNLKNRTNRYKNLLCNNQKLLYASLRKYGFDNHKFEILLSIPCQEFFLNELEILFIKIFNSFNGKNKFGMNLTTGGEGTAGRIVSVETRRKMSISSMGKRNSPESIEKMRKSLTGRKASAETIIKLRNRPYTQEHKNNIGAKLKGHIVTEETRSKISKSLFEPILVTSKDGIVREYESQREYSILHGIRESSIHRWMRNLHANKDGLKFDYKNEPKHSLYKTK